MHYECPHEIPLPPMLNSTLDQPKGYYKVLKLAKCESTWIWQPLSWFTPCVSFGPVLWVKYQNWFFPQVSCEKMLEASGLHLHWSLKIKIAFCGKLKHWKIKNNVHSMNKNQSWPTYYCLNSCMGIGQHITIPCPCKTFQSDGNAFEIL